VEVLWVDAEGGRPASPDDLPALLERDDGFVWVDVPPGDDGVEDLLTRVFSFHPRAVRDCLERNHVPKLHVYPDHLFVVLHSPEQGPSGHVHYLELDQFVGGNFLVTVHGPINPVVPVETALRETRLVAARLASGRIHPHHPLELSYLVVSAVVRHEEEFVGTLARDVGLLEQEVMAGVEEDPVAFLERLYQARHRLLTVRTMAGQTREVYGRACRLSTFLPENRRPLLDDLLDQYGRIERITHGQIDFLHGVTEFYRARTDTKMTIAAERLAVIAALTLPVTAVSSVLGMNVIVNSSTHWVALGVILLAILVMSLWLLRWARKQGWW